MADVWSTEAWEEETPVNKLLGTLTLAMLLATALITTAARAGGTPGSLPAAVD
jgi:hypothetical protein